MTHSDPLDEAAAHTQHLIEIALSNMKIERMPYTGQCYNCDDSIIKGSYCSPECREDHQKLLWSQKNRSVV